MKKISFIALVLGLSMFCSKAPEAPKAEVGTESKIELKGTPVPINTEKSIVKWVGTKVTGQHNGTVKISSGSVYFEGDSLTGGSFIMDMKSIDDLDLSGEWEAKLEQHLKSDEFFDVEKYPTAEFVFNEIGPIGADGSTEIKGNLKIKDITNSIKIPAKITFDGNKKPIGAVANFNINRQLWKITYPGKPDDLIKDDINLELNISL